MSRSTDIEAYSKVFCAYMIDKGARSAFEYTSELPREMRGDVIREGAIKLNSHKQEFIDAVLNS